MDDRFLGTTAVCFVFNFCLLCSHRLPVSERNLPVPKPFFRWVFKICFEWQNRNLQKKSYRFKTSMDFVSQILIKLKTSSNEGLLMKVFSHSLMWLSKHCSGHYVTTQACTLISWGCLHLRWCGALEDYTLWTQIRENIKAARPWPLCGARWIPWTNVQYRGKNVSIWWRHHVLCVLQVGFMHFV